MKQITYIVIACTIVLLGSCELDYSEGTVYSKEEMFAMRAKGIAFDKNTFREVD